MADTTRNIFSLSEYSDDTIAGDGIPVDSVYVKPNAADNAYIGGGTGGPSGNQISIMDKLTFSTGGLVRVPSANLTNFGGNNSAPFSSGTAGYFVAGNTGNSPGAAAQDRRSYVRKLTYATETVSNAVPDIPESPGSMGQGPQGMGGANSATAGYAMGGSGESGGDERSWVFKLLFAGDSWSQLPNLPSSTHYQGDAIGNLDAGYLAGGSPGVRTMVQKVTYSTDTLSRNPASNLTTGGRYFAGAGNAVAGFLMGRGTSPTAHSAILKFTYSTETASLHPSNLPNPVKTARGTGNLSTGYAAGGQDGPGSTVYSTVSKLDYSTGTASNLGTNMTRGQGYDLLAVSARDNGATGYQASQRWKDDGSITPNDGYSISGGSPTVTIVDRLSMSTDSVARVPGMDSYKNTWMMGTTAASSTTKGYYGGEYGGGVSSIWNIVYATDGREHNPSLNLSTGIAYYNSAGNANKGYVLGGFIAYPAPARTLSSVHRMTYSSDSTSRIPGANIPAAPTPNDATGEGSAAFSSSGDESGAAYLTGGNEWPSQGNRSYIWKMSYPTETTSLLPARVPNTRISAAAHSEKSAGYLTGGWTGSPPTSVLKFPWSTETFVADGGDGMHRVGASTGNQQYAYVMGGISNTTGSGTSAIKKFEYSTSTSSQITGTLTGTPSTAPRQGSWGTGALTNNLPSVPEAPIATPTPLVSKEKHTYGIYRTSYRSYSQKKDFTTGTTSTIPTTGNVQVAADLVSDENAIYTNDWNAAGRSTKIPWATQTGTSSPNTWSTSVNPYFTGGRTATNMSPTKGYFTGGQYPSISPSPNNGVGNRRQHIVFATGTGVSEGGKAEDYIYFAASSNSATRGYMYGGYNANEGGTSKITYMNFATDGSFNAVPGTPGFTLAYNRAEAAAVGNKDKAYIAGTRYNVPGIPAQISRMEKFTYSTETRQTMPGLNTPYASNRDMSATGDQEKGYWAGSFNNPNAFVITYATETKSGTPNYPVPTNNSSPRAISQAQNAQPGNINVPVSVL